MSAVDSDDGSIQAVLNTRNHKGLTPLHFAVEAADPRSVKLLVDSGADVDIQDLYGVSPLQLATLQGYTEVIDVLSVGSANVDASARDQRLLSAEQSGKAANAKSKGGGWGGALTASAELDSTRCDLQRVSARDMQNATEFISRFVARNTPVVLTG